MIDQPSRHNRRTRPNARPVNTSSSTVTSTSGELAGSPSSSPDDVVKAQAIQAAWEQEQANPKGWEASEIITGIASLGGAVGGGWYAYKAKDGSFWWTVLGVLVGNAGGWLVGRLVTLPLR